MRLLPQSQEVVVERRNRSDHHPRPNQMIRGSRLHCKPRRQEGDGVEWVVCHGGGRGGWGRQWRARQSGGIGGRGGALWTGARRLGNRGGRRSVRGRIGRSSGFRNPFPLLRFLSLETLPRQVSIESTGLTSDGGTLVPIVGKWWQSSGIDVGDLFP